MNNKSYFMQYESPNIVIVPTMDCQPPKRQKLENNIVVPIVDEATFNKHKLIQKSDQSNAAHAANNERGKLGVQSPSTAKKASWATNYLQSIGLVPKASIWQQKIPRKTASQSSNICINTTETSKSDRNNAPVDKSNNLKQSMPASNIIKINDKPNLVKKNLSPPEKTIKKIKKDRDHLKDNKRLKNETVTSVVNKRVNDIKTKKNTGTSLNDKKTHSTNKIKLNNEKTNSNYLKQPTNCKDNNNPHVKNKDLYKKSEKEIVNASKNNKNSKVLTDQLKKLKNTKRHIGDKKSSLKTKKSLMDISSKVKSKRNLSIPSTRDSRDDVKKTNKEHENTIGAITSVKKILKVTKKYDVSDLDRVKVTKNNNISTNTKQHTSKTCKKDLREKLSRKENNLKTSHANHKRTSSLPIKKQTHKTKNYRKIKLVINVICNEPSSRLSNINKNSDSRKECAASNIELDFLNDFNIDEIVESLDKCDRDTKNQLNENLIQINNAIPLINANVADATDLIKILKGEEDDDFITQSIENTNGSLFGCNFQNTQNTETYNGLSHSFEKSNCDISENGSEVPIKIKEESLDMFSESEQNNIITENINIKALNQTGYNTHQTKYEPVNLVSKKDSSNVENIPKSVQISESSILSKSSYKNDNTSNNQINATEDKSAKNLEHSSTEMLRNPVTEENTTIETKEKLNFNSKCALKTQKASEYTKNCEISDSDQSKDIKKQEDKKSKFQNIKKCDSEKNTITQCNELTKDKELCVNLKAATELFHNTDPIIEIKDDKTSTKPKDNENTILVSEPGKLDIVDNTENKILNCNTLQKTYVEHEKSANQENDENNSIELNDNEYIVNGQVINTGDRNKKNKIEANYVTRHEQVPNSEKQALNELSCNEDNLENNVIIDKNIKEFQKAQHLHNESSQSVILKKDKTVNLKALSSPMFKVKEEIANQLQESIFTCLKIKYSVTSLLHQGQFSTIFKCKHPSGKNYALKILTNTKQNMETKKDMWMSLQLYMPRKTVFIVYLVNAFEFEEKWYILMDYYPKNLDHVLKEAKKSLSVETIQDYARQLVTAVVFLRNNNMVHSDIKPQHILINSSNNILKLCGLDRLCYVNKLTMLPNVGTVNYRAPEVILGYPAGFEIDVWSTGVVLFEIAANQKLFPGTYNNDILYKQICTLGYVPYDMICKSRFGSNHFMGAKFMRRMGPGGKNIDLIKKFAKNNKLSHGIFNAYYKSWSHLRSNTQQINDIEKLHTFVNLLQKMLVIHPRHRLSIEFAYGNQFIYDAYKYHAW